VRNKVAIDSNKVITAFFKLRQKQT